MVTWGSPDHLRNPHWFPATPVPVAACSAKLPPRPKPTRPAEKARKDWQQHQRRKWTVDGRCFFNSWERDPWLNFCKSAGLLLLVPLLRWRRWALGEILGAERQMLEVPLPGRKFLWWSTGRPFHPNTVKWWTSGGLAQMKEQKGHRHQGCRDG